MFFFPDCSSNNICEPNSFDWFFKSLVAFTSFLYALDSSLASLIAFCFCLFSLSVSLFSADCVFIFSRFNFSFCCSAIVFSFSSLIVCVCKLFALSTNCKNSFSSLEPPKDALPMLSFKVLPSCLNSTSTFSSVTIVFSALLRMPSKISSFSNNSFALICFAIALLIISFELPN